MPLIFSGIAWSAMLIYSDIVWQYFPGLGCKSGWWVYGLTTIPSGERIKQEVVGIFYLTHTPTKAYISEGRASYVQGDELRFRGDWSADTVWIESKNIQVIYSMHAVNPPPIARPERHDGYLSFSRVKSTPLIGRESWEGHIQDLGDRRDVAGWIYCERLSRWFCTREECEQIMRDCSGKLIARVRSKVQAQNPNPP